MDGGVAVVLLSILILQVRSKREKPESGFANSKGEEEKVAIFCKFWANFSRSYRMGQWLGVFEGGGAGLDVLFGFGC